MDITLNYIKKNFANIINIVKPKNQGKLSCVYFADYNDTKIVIKIPMNAGSLSKEIQFYELLKNIELPSPKILSYNYKNIYRIPEYLIMTKLNGAPLHDNCCNDSTKFKIYADIGIYLKMIHSINYFSYSTTFTPYSCDGVINFNSWIEYLNSEIGVILNKVQLSGIFSVYHVEKFRNHFKKLVNIDYNLVLLHGDLGPDHLYFRHDKFEGIIDPGLSFLGPKEYDLAYMAIYTDPHYFHKIASTYGPYSQELVDSLMLLILSQKILRHFENEKVINIEKFINVISTYKLLD